MGHLSDLQDDYGKKGLHVLALTGEERRMNLQYMVHTDNNFTFKVGLRGGGAYEVRGIPHAYLIDTEGTVVWEGSPGSLSKKVIEAELKKVREPTEEEAEARASKMLKHGEALANEGLVLRAEIAFEKLVKTYPKTASAEAAKERAGEMSADDNKAEYDAQASIAKMVGGPEVPDPYGKKTKGKKLEKNAKKLRKYAESWAETAPRSAKLAEEYAFIFENKWR